MIGTLFDRLRARKQPGLGPRGEDLAHRFLRREGYTIVARNYRLASGDAEADIIAWEGDTLAIVEVKTRATAEFGPPERAIGPEKQRHILRVARQYARRSDIPWEKVRFDTVAVVMTDPPTIELVRGAFRT